MVAAMKKKLKSFIILQLAAVLIASAVMAFEYSGYKWEDKDLPLKYRINSANRPEWLSQDILILTVQKGFQAWNNVSCSDMEFQYDGITGSLKSRDEVHSVFWNSTGMDMGAALAIATRWLNFNGDRLYDADLEINGTEPWSVSGEAGKYDLQSVITHEAGHFLSLSDLYAEKDREKTMYGYLYDGDISPRTLDSDDIAGICSIYPANELAILTISIPKSIVGIPYHQQLQVGGGAAPYAWQVISGALPPGLVLRGDTGIIEGTPETEGGYSFTIQVRDARSVSQSRIFTMQTATNRQPDIFGIEIGNKITVQGISSKDGPYTDVNEYVSIDQNTFPVDTYMQEGRENGVLNYKGWMQRASNEIRIWGFQEGAGGDIYKFSSGLLYAWQPMNVGDNRFTSSSMEVVGLPGYVFNISLNVDVLSRETVTTVFGAMNTYKMRHQIRMWGYGVDETSTSFDWVVPYLGSVKFSDETSQESMMSFVIGGGTITPETDFDGDGLKDYQELSVYNTNWQIADTDNDGLSDADEVTRGTDATKDDTDGDGLKDGWEVKYGFDPLSVNNAQQDPDGDGLSNLMEQALGTHPLLADTDKDGLSDADEVTRGTDPTRDDTDGDGLKDGWEVKYGFDPLSVNNAQQDPDGDGLSNLTEQALGTNPLLADTDKDGLSDADEVTRGTDPTRDDTDGDGLKDGWEVKYGFDPLSVNNAQQDPDGDGLSNLTEQALGTNPLLADTDGDGCSDRAEALGGRDPNVADPQGDINNDCAINISDAILICKIMARMNTVVSNIDIRADVNDDGKIALPEVIYILQKVAGMR